MFVCFLMFGGVIFYSFAIGGLSSMLVYQDQKDANFEQKLTTLNAITKKYKINSSLYNKIKTQLRYEFKKENDEKLFLLKELPNNLKLQLSYVMHSEMIQQIQMFRNQSKRLIASIGPHLKQIKVNAGEYIVSQGEYANEIYFIKSGNISLVIKKYNNFKFIYIEEGFYFGEVDLLFGETRKYTVMANVDIELLAMSKKDFTKIFFQDFKEIGSQLYNKALKRRHNYLKAYKEAHEFCKKQLKLQEDQLRRKTFLKQQKKILTSNEQGSQENQNIENNNLPINMKNNGDQEGENERQEDQNNMKQSKKNQENPKKNKNGLEGQSPSESSISSPTSESKESDSQHSHASIELERKNSILNDAEKQAQVINLLQKQQQQHINQQNKLLQKKYSIATPALLQKKSIVTPLQTSISNSHLKSLKQAFQQKKLVKSLKNIFHKSQAVDAVQVSPRQNKSVFMKNQKLQDSKSPNLEKNNNSDPESQIQKTSNQLNLNSNNLNTITSNMNDLQQQTSIKNNQNRLSVDGSQQQTQNQIQSLGQPNLRKSKFLQQNLSQQLQLSNALQQSTEEEKKVQQSQDSTEENIQNQQKKNNIFSLLTINTNMKQQEQKISQENIISQESQQQQLIQSQQENINNKQIPSLNKSSQEQQKLQNQEVEGGGGQKKSLNQKWQSIVNKIKENNTSDKQQNGKSQKFALKKQQSKSFADFNKQYQEEQNDLQANSKQTAQTNNKKKVKNEKNLNNIIHNLKATTNKKISVQEAVIRLISLKKSSQKIISQTNIPVQDIENKKPQEQQQLQEELINKLEMDQKFLQRQERLQKTIDDTESKLLKIVQFMEENQISVQSYYNINQNLSEKSQQLQQQQKTTIFSPKTLKLKLLKQQKSNKFKLIKSQSQRSNISKSQEVRQGLIEEINNSAFNTHHSHKLSIFNIQNFKKRNSQSLSQSSQEQEKSQNLNVKDNLENQNVNINKSSPIKQNNLTRSSVFSFQAYNNSNNNNKNNNNNNDLNKNIKEFQTQK